VRDLLQLVEDDYELNDRATTDDLLRITRKRIGPFFGSMRASQVTSEMIDRYAIKRRNEGMSNRTVNIEVAVLKRGYSLGISKRKITYKTQWTDLKEAPARSGFFEWDQFEVVLKHLPERLQPVARFAYITGWRSQSEVLRLQWPCVDFKAGAGPLAPGHTGRIRPWHRPRLPA